MAMLAMLRQPVDRIAGEGGFHPDGVGRRRFGVGRDGQFHREYFQKSTTTRLVGVVLCQHKSIKSSEDGSGLIKGLVSGTWKKFSAEIRNPNVAGRNPNVAGRNPNVAGPVNPNVAGR